MSAVDILTSKYGLMMEVKDVAAELKLSRATVRELCRSGVIKAVRFEGTRKWLVPVSSLAELPGMGE